MTAFWRAAPYMRLLPCSGFGSVFVVYLCLSGQRGGARASPFAGVPVALGLLGGTTVARL